MKPNGPALPPRILSSMIRLKSAATMGVEALVPPPWPVPRDQGTDWMLFTETRKVLAIVALLLTDKMMSDVGRAASIIDVVYGTTSGCRLFPYGILAQDSERLTCRKVRKAASISIIQARGVGPFPVAEESKDRSASVSNMEERCTRSLSIASRRR